MNHISNIGLCLRSWGIALFFPVLTLFAEPGQAQCSLDYSTTNFFCDLDSLYLHANPITGTGPFSFIWETGETTQTIVIPLAYGDYMVTMTDATGCVAIINCHIKPFPQVLYYPYNQNACEGDTVILFLEWFRDSIPGATYLWSTGETTPTITLTDDLVWSVTITDPNTGCEFIIPPNLFDFHPTPYPTIIGPTMLCPGQTATLSVEGGPFGTIYWYPADVYQPTLDITEPGEYTVYAYSVEAGYCWHTDTIVVQPGDIDPPLLTGPPPLCSGQSGTINITNSNLYNGFDWSTGESSSSITVNAPGTYTVTVSNGTGCTATGSITVDQNAGPQGTAVPTATTCGESNGSIDLSVSPPSSYAFVWSNGMNTEDISNVPAGVYTVTITDLSGCTSVVSSTIPDQPIILTITEVVLPNTSCSQFNGSINISISPSGIYTYLWSNGAATEDIANLAPGSYSVTVTKGVNCTATGTYTIADQSNAVNITSTIVPSTCGLSNGSVVIQLNGGTAPFTILWSNGNTTEQLSNINSGNYQVTVTGADGCTSTASVDVPDEIIPIDITALVTSNTSCTNSNGAIDITVTPVENYTYGWSTGAFSEDLFNIGAGNYTVTVSFGNTCVQTADFTVINENIPFSLSGLTQPNTSCQIPNGAIDLQVLPAGSYLYNWSNGSGIEDLQNLDAGNYEVTVTNTDGCAITALFNIISQVPVILITGLTLNNTSCSSSNGSIDLTLNPAGVYTYNWSNGAVTEDLQNLSAANYAVTVTDGNQCSADTSFLIVNDTPAVTWTAQVQEETCLSGNGGISLIANPSDNTYQWSNADTTTNPQGLAAGQYIVTITSAAGCIYQDTFLIQNLNSNFNFTGTTTDNTSCVLPNGNIDLNVFPAGNYTFAWSTGATSEDIGQLAAGQYLVTITDSSQCASTGSFIIGSNTPDPVITGLITPSTCNASNGTIDLTITPALNNTFLWSNGAVSEDLANLSPGIYSITVTGSNGCMAMADFVVPNQNLAININGSVLPLTNCVSANGAIDVSIFPAGTYSYLWSNGANIEDIGSLTAGIYSVTVTDQLGCSTSASFTIDDQTAAPSIANVVTPSTCNQPNGQIDISVTPVGVYSFSWSNSATSEDITNLLSGAYQVTVTGLNGCSASASFTVPDQNSNFVINASVTDNQSCVLGTGAIDLTITPAGSYTFLWSNGLITEDLIQLSSGIYTVTVTDPFHCEASDLFTIEDISAAPVMAGIVTPTKCGKPNGAIDITVIPPGGNQFRWSNGASTEDLANLAPGSYSLTITDLNGCTASDNFQIAGSSPVIIDINIDLTQQAQGQFTCNLEINQPLSSIESITWTPEEMMSCQEVLCMEQTFSITQPTQIDVMVIDTNGCFGTDRLLLDVEKDYKVYIPNVFTPNGDGKNDGFTIYGNEEIVEVVILEIFDRWGNNVFAKGRFPPNDPQLGWNGVFKRQLMNPDVFAYRAVVRYSNGELHHFKGDVTLVQ